MCFLRSKSDGSRKCRFKCLFSDLRPSDLTDTTKETGINFIQLQDGSNNHDDFKIKVPPSSPQV